jgi:hypothetical protein
MDHDPSILLQTQVRNVGKRNPHRCGVPTFLNSRVLYHASTIASAQSVNRGDNFSEFTSWSTDQNVAVDNATQWGSSDRGGDVAGESPLRVFRYAPASPFHLTRYETNTNN